MSVNFYPRSPCGERPRERTSIKPIFSISIHALLAESDQHQRKQKDGTQQFLSTLSLRRATTNLSILCQQFLNFYPRSPCGERRAWSASKLGGISISIHALLAESDIVIALRHVHSVISIHALLAESDFAPFMRWVYARLFLSTLSLRRATYMAIYPQCITDISIHALLAESDPRCSGAWSTKFQFLSTLSLRRATSKTGSAANSSSDFYPRSPCGERPLHAGRNV